MGKDKQDKINPDHYRYAKFECIEVIKEATKELGGTEGYLIGTILKYLWRWKRKNGLEDLKKAKWYLEYLINYVAGRTEK